MAAHPWLAYDALRPERAVPCGAASVAVAVRELERRGAVSVVISFDGSKQEPVANDGLRG